MIVIVLLIGVPFCPPLSTMWRGARGEAVVFLADDRFPLSIREVPCSPPNRDRNRAPNRCFLFPLSRRWRGARGEAVFHRAFDEGGSPGKDAFHRVPDPLSKKTTVQRFNEKTPS